MADINQQTEELARIMEQVNREMVMYGQITKTTADQKRDAEIQAATGMKNFTKASDTAADAVGHLASAGMAAGKAMLEGKKGAAAFNESIDGLSKAATAAGVALTLLVPGGAIIKGIVAGFTALTAATAGMVKASNEMADKIYKGYSGLAKSGAAASDGMTGVFNDAKKLGLSMNELDSFVGLVGENAGDLALFAGSVFEGRQKFAEMGEAMEPYRKQMIAAGMTQEQINEGAMGYLRLQTRLGQSQNKTTAELASGAKKYLEEQDALTKLTGMTRKEQEDAREEIRSQERFAAVLMEMRANGQEKEAEELENTFLILKSQSKEAAQGFADVSTGMIGTAAAQKSFMASQGESMKVAELVKSNQMTAAEAAQRVAAAHGRTADDMGASLGKMGVYNETFGDLAADLRLKGMSASDIEEKLKKVKQEQIDQGLKGGKAADGITDQYAKNIAQQQKLNAKMEQTVFDGIDNALAITNKLGNATDVLATGFEKLGTAVNKLLKIVGLGAEETPEEKAKVETDKKQDQKNFESATFTEKIQSSLARGIEHAARGVGDLVGSSALVGLADAAQQERVAAESAYLKEKGRFQQVSPVGGQRALPAGTAPSAAGGGRGVVAPPSGPPPAAPAGGAASTTAPATASTTAPATASTTAPARSLTPPPPSAGVPDGQPATAAPAGQVPGGGNGSLRIGPAADMSGLNNEMMSRLTQFAKASGRAVDVTSAFRSDQKQAELWVRGHILKEKGIHMPAAPKEDQEVNYKGKTYQVKGSGKGSLHGVGNAVDIAGMEDKRGPIDDLLANYGLFRPFIKDDHPHVQMLAEGGIVQPTPGGTPAIIGEGGNAEAVIPLKNGAVPVSLDMKNAMQPGGIGPTAFGMNEFTGYNSGPLTTDLDAIKDIAAKLGAYDASTKLITDPTTWKQILSSGIATNYDLGMAEIGTKMIPGIGADIGERIKELKDAGGTGTDTVAVIKQVTDEFRSAMFEAVKNMGGGNNAQAGEQLMLLTELVREQRNANDINTRILQVSSN